MQPEQNYLQQTPEESLQAPVQTIEALPPAPAEDVLSWQASEYIHQEKDGIWFLGLLGAAAVLLLIDIFLVKSWTFGTLIVVMAISVGVIARRPPRMLEYTLSPEGIQIDQKHFGFTVFRAFGVIQEGAFYSIRLVPNKRFMPMVSVFFPPEMGEAIVDVFGSHLPMEQLTLDPIDKLVEKLRF
jgi:hypothetical protein